MCINQMSGVAAGGGWTGHKHHTCSLGPITNSSAMGTYRVLAWNSRWRSPIGLTQSDLMTSLSHGTADWFSPVSVANELSAQHSHIWLVLVVAVCSVLQKPSTFPSSTCIDLLQGDSCMLWGGYFMYDIFAAAVFLTCSQRKTYNFDVFQRLKRTNQYVFLAKKHKNIYVSFYIIKIFVSMHFYHFINKRFRFLDPLTYPQT